MTEMPQPEYLNMGNSNIPEPLLPLLACLLHLYEINSAIACCRELHGPAITEDATAYLETELVDDNIARLGMTLVASVEWGPRSWADEEHRAEIYMLPVPDHGELVVVRWWDEIPRWWGYGGSAAEIEVVIESLERRVGRTYNRVVWHPSA